MSTRTLKGKTLFITGASRGIGLAIAMRAAKDGANVVIAAKTDAPNPKLPGTIHTAAEEITKAGGAALACVVDVRDENQIAAAVLKAKNTFGGIDVLVNNASAISLTGTLETPLKRFDLMHQINTRGTYACSQACIPHLLEAENPHILNISPPLAAIQERWFAPHVGYTMAKFGMTLCVLGMAGEFKGRIGVNALWPRTVIDTSAVKNLLGGDPLIARARKPEIMADAAHAILTRDAKTTTGNYYIDEDVLRAEGVKDLGPYSVVPGADLLDDFFLP